MSEGTQYFYADSVSAFHQALSSAIELAGLPTSPAERQSVIRELTKQIDDLKVPAQGGLSQVLLTEEHHQQIAALLVIFEQAHCLIPFVLTDRNDEKTQ